MAGETSDEEQVEELKKWLEENLTSLIVTVIVVLAAVFGYRTWDTQQLETAEAASAIYEELNEAVTVGPLDALSEEKGATANFLAEQLKTEFGGSVYSNLAAFHLAKIAVEKGELETAKTELTWALDNSADDKIAVLTNYRLAKVLHALADYDTALTQLDSMKAGGHLASYEELRGDIFKAQGKSSDAREAYQRAINAYGEGVPGLTQMKLDDLISPKAAIAADTSAASTEGAAVENAASKAAEEKDGDS